MITNRFKIILLVIGTIIFLPLIAMQFSNEVNWSTFDFIVMGVLLLITGTTCEIILRFVQKFHHRVILCLLLFAAFLLVWAELAVGIFGTPFAGS